MQKKILNVYAVCDGVIDLIENIDDKVFKNNSLGIGYFISATSNEIYNPIENANVDLIFETNHGLFLKQNNLNSSIMINMCLDFELEDSKYFKIVKEQDDKLKNFEKIAKVNLEYLKVVHKNTNIAVVINDESNRLNWTFKPYFTGPTKVKKGQLIGTFESILEPEREIEVDKYFKTSSNWDLLARRVIELVGRKANYSNSYNCSTRLRFKIKDKSLVDINSLQEISQIKAVVWKNNELQLILGKNVYKLYNALKIIENSGEFDLLANRKMSFKKRMLVVISSISMPLIPIMIGSGIIMAFVGVLQISKIMPDIVLKMPESGLKPGQEFIKETNVLWAILYVISNTPLRFMGVLAGLSAARYFKLNMYIAMSISIILGSPLIFGDGGPIGFGYTWDLFKTGISPNDPVWSGLSSIKIMPQGARIIVVILAIIITKKVDNWIATWVPKSLELILKSALTLLISALITFFIIGPIWYIFEQLIAVGLRFVTAAPLGIGTGIYALIWQPLVVIGMHSAVGQISQMQVLTDGVSYLTPGGEFSVWGQVGAVVAVIIISKNGSTKREARSTVITGFFGVPAPIVYGINLPKVRPFIAGTLGAFFAGCLSNMLSVSQRVGTGLGVFSFFGFFSNPINPEIVTVELLPNALNGFYNILCCMLSVALALMFTIFMYKERSLENNIIKKNNIKLIKIINLSNSNLSTEDKQKIVNILKTEENFFTKEEVIKIKKIERLLIESLKYKINREILFDKENKIKEKLFEQGSILINKGKIVKAKAIMEKHKKVFFEIKKEDLQMKIQQLDKKMVDKLEWLNQAIKKKEEIIINNLNELENYFSLEDFNSIKLLYKNSINDLKITYKLSNPIDVKITLNKIIKKISQQNNVNKKANKIIG
ncbi:PTS transporter subunit EIIC [Spiroplasma cantharicola]|uniref:PTS system, beta-glucoside-specific IIABC component n=1 Tax=Spiroplasma cantharicola TaxID=362837 RepID=A0A0M4KEN1_9MOLU|nr:PTS transporter subunit EIIC [Spiroplasma cantharicola]ALD66482.1 PTS system, beta-glucoside-specific IIABC component [Spiroplasma cantharicola]